MENQCECGFALLKAVTAGPDPDNPWEAFVSLRNRGVPSVTLEVVRRPIYINRSKGRTLWSSLESSSLYALFIRAASESRALVWYLHNDSACRLIGGTAHALSYAPLAGLCLGFGKEECL